jgi:hypothetical protein
MQRILVIAGLALLLAGLAWPWLFRLPGDIHIVREGLSIHFSIVTCVLVSILLSVLMWIFRR